MSTGDLPTSATPAKARLGPYALWQLRDYLVDRGAPTFLIAALFGSISVYPIVKGVDASVARLSARSLAAYGGLEAARRTMLLDTSELFLRNFLGSLVFLGALFAMNGIVANDRKQGFYRFLFAKPLSPSRYYGQAFVVHWIGFLGVALLLMLLYGALVLPVISVPLLAALALMFLCYAGIAFLLSAAARWDWLSLVAVTVAAQYLWDQLGDSPSALARLVYLLPPIPRTGEVYAAAAKGVALPWHTLLWLAGYGAACFVAGLVVLRHRRLAII
jgi:hypothetical protein